MSELETVGIAEAFRQLRLEFERISETFRRLAEFAASTTRVDALHAEALGKLAELVNTLHDSVTRHTEALQDLANRLTVIEKRLALQDFSGMAPEPKPLKQPDWGPRIDYSTPPGTLVRTEVTPKEKP